MYERYYGLRQRPFNLTSNPRYLLLTSAHAEALSSLQYGIGSRLGIIVLVGEAHALPYEILEEIRLLANIETDEEKLLPVVLAGQPELGNRLNNPDLRQLKQRVALRCSLRALTLKETAAYIAGRIGVAGGDAANIFTGKAVQLIHRYSRGVPRTISVICDNALVTGFAADERPIDVGTVCEVCRDLDLTIPEPEIYERAISPAASSGE